jgi:hypothetical protein
MRGAHYWVIFVLIVCWPAAAASISGTYVGTLPGAAALVQVVQNGEGQLAGRLEIVGLAESGKLVSNGVPISGATDSGTIVMTLQLPGLFAVIRRGKVTP